MQSLYIPVPVESFLHRANPFTKMVFLLFCVVSAFVPPWPLLWGATVALLTLAFAAAIGRQIFIRYLLLSLPFTFAVFAFHGLIMSRPDFQQAFGWLPYSPAGLEYAAVVGGRISLMLTASLLFVATTHPSALLRSLDAARWPPAASFLLASPLLLIDQFTARANAIRDAQQTRGLALGGTVTARFHALRILVVPLLTLALSDAHERANVLTARGFRALPWRTVIDPPRDSTGEKILRAAFAAAMVAEIGYVILA